MTTKKTIKLKKGFEENRKQVKARVFSKLLNMSEFNWKDIQVNICSDEGKEFISISSDLNESNPVEIFFDIDTVPSLIATLKNALNTAHKDLIDDRIKWEEIELEEQN